VNSEVSHGTFLSQIQETEVNPFSYYNWIEDEVHSIAPREFHESKESIVARMKSQRKDYGIASSDIALTS
jgi:hypothetical protein